MKRSRELEEVDPSPADTTDAVARPHFKIAGLDSAVEDDLPVNDIGTMRCSLPPHKDPIPFRSYGEYEAHYNSFHTNRCHDCRKNFPSEHLLGVHIEECHDPLVVIKREKGEHTYSCFVEGCERKCLTHQKRRRHMIDKHMFPENYFFAVTKEGIDGRRSLLIESGHRRRRSSAATVQSKSQEKDATADGNTANAQAQGKQENGKPKAALKAPAEEEAKTEEAPDREMTDLSEAMSSLQFVPPSIRFGRGRAGFSKR